MDHILDIVLATPIAWGLIRGFQKGFLLEILWFLAFFLASVVALKLVTPAENIFIQKLISVKDAQKVSPWILFIITFTAAILIGKLLSTLIKFTPASMINRIAGAIFGGLKWLLILSVILMFVPQKRDFGYITEKRKNESILYGKVYHFSSLILPTMKEFQSKYFNR